MATNPQAFIQPLAQANSPFLANNGNPNTVYNTAATPFQNAPVAASVPVQLPAATAPPVGAYAAPAARFWENLSGFTPAQFNTDLSGLKMPNNNWNMKPPTAPPVAPPTTPPITPWTPPTNVGGGGVGPGGMGGSSQGPGSNRQDWMLFPPQAVTFNDNKGTISDGKGNSWSLNPVESITNGLSNLVSDASKGLGFNGRDGSFDANQFIDALTEVIMPGNLYNQNTGNWNMANIGRAVLNSVVPGLGKLATWLISKLPAGNALRTWLMKQELDNSVDEAIENVMDAPQGGGSEGSREFIPGGVRINYGPGASVSSPWDILNQGTATVGAITNAA